MEILKKVMNKELKIKQEQVIQDDTGWVTVNNVLKYRKVGRTVTVIGSSAGIKTIGGGEYTVIGNLPLEARPTQLFQFEFSLTGGAATGRAARCSPNGDVTLYLRENQTSEYWGFVITYVV